MPGKEPRPPQNLTPLQIIEWNNNNSGSIKDFEVKIKNKSFLGEILTLSPAEVQDISPDRIKAIARYGGSSSEGFEDGFSVYYGLLEVKYDLFFDINLYQTILLIHNNSMIEFEGEITKFSYSCGNAKTVHGNQWTSYNFNISLNLTSIKSIKRKELKPSLIGASLPRNSSCFIATAAFGNPDKTEVLQLREYRDKVLMTSIIGRVCIFVYLFISPPLADIIRDNGRLRKAARGFLRFIVLPLTKVFH